MQEAPEVEVITPTKLDSQEVEIKRVRVLIRFENGNPIITGNKKAYQHAINLLYPILALFPDLRKIQQEDGKIQFSFIFVNKVFKTIKIDFE